MGLFSFIFGSDARRSLKKLSGMADKILALDETYKVMSDEELTSQTSVLK